MMHYAKIEAAIRQGTAADILKAARTGIGIAHDAVQENRGLGIDVGDLGFGIERSAEEAEAFQRPERQLRGC